MKIRRIFAVFFSLLLAVVLSVSALAADGDVGSLEGGEVAAKAALLIDPDTEEILYARNIHERLYPASLTKIMTASLVLEAVDSGKLTMDTVLTASETALAGLPADGSNAGIKVGEELTVRDLLQCVMTVSANEACNVLAEAVSGSVADFVEAMNAKAQALGCENTHFANTNGLQDIQHYTSAWDMYLIVKNARTHPDFMPLSNNRHVEIPATNLSAARNYYTTNHLISTWRSAKYLYSGAEGIKTGSTSDAGLCLISSATRSGRSLISVVLGAQRVTLEDNSVQMQNFSETIRLFDYGFDGFTRQIILSDDELIDEVPVTLSQEVNAVKVHPAQEIERLIPKNLDPEKDIKREWTFIADSVEAPIQRGQVLGQITLSCDGTVYGTVDLLADDNVTASRLLVFQRDALLFLKRPIVKLALIGAAALIVLIIVLRAALGSRRRRYGRSSGGYRGGGYRGRRR